MARYQDTIQTITQLLAKVNFRSKGVTEPQFLRDMLLSQNGGIDSAVPVLTAGATTDEMDITITVKDANGNTIADAHNLEVWISDSATTKVLTSTGASGALAAIDGAVLSVLTAKKHITCVTPVTGIINLSLIDSANTAGEVVYVKLPNGLTSQSALSVAGSYEGG